MEVIERKTSELLPYEKNPRRNEGAVKAVAASIKEFGFKVPIVVDGNDVIVAGDTRLKAAKLLKLKTVPTVVADDLTPEQIKAFRLADNKVAELSGWDFEALEQELADLEASGFDLSAIVDFPMFDIDELEVASPDTDKLFTHFDVTFAFPVEYKDSIQSYLKEYGKDEIVDDIIRRATDA